MSTNFGAAHKQPAAKSATEPVWLGGRVQQRTVKYDERAHAYYIVVGRHWLEVEAGSDNTWATTGNHVEGGYII